MKIIQVVLTIMFVAMAVIAAYNEFWFETFCFSAYTVALYIVNRQYEAIKRLHEETRKQQDRSLQMLLRVYQENRRMAGGKNEQKHSNRA